MQAKKADGARRNVRDVVEYLITIPDVKEAIKADGSKVKLRFAADGRRTSKRIGTVMAVFNILSEGKQTYECQYTLALYNGKWRDSSFIRKGSATINRPYSYSRYRTGTSLQERLMRGSLFKYKFIPPH